MTGALVVGGLLDLPSSYIHVTSMIQTDDVAMKTIPTDMACILLMSCTVFGPLLVL